MKPFLSVIICTHNPRLDYLFRVLQALSHQSLPQDNWELLLIDNASEIPLSSAVDLSWHSQSRYISEQKLGLTSARLKGISEAASDTLVFIDDDNVLDETYLESALQVSKDWSILGAWGGQIVAEFEAPPMEWTKSYWGKLAIREFDRDRWSNLPQIDCCPWGAGLCVRKAVAKQYSDLTLSDSRRLNLDRSGNQLFGCGDMDLAYTACDLGLGIGLFTALKLTHLIPSSRIQESYFLRLTEGNSYSTLILNYLRGNSPKMNKSWRRRLFEYYCFLGMNSRERRFFRVHNQGESLAIKQILNWMASSQV